MAVTLSVTPMVRRILSVYRSATAAQLDAGTNWYSDAHGIASDYALAHNVTTEVAAGIIAALSPMQSYGANLNLARRFLASKGTLDHGYLSLGLGKARDIYNGSDILPTLNGDKVKNFYQSIVTAGKDGVTIDRHAYCLAIGERAKNVNLTPKRYALVASAYVRAAEIAGITPAEIQAVTWVVWRQRYWAVGAFDPRA